MSGNFNNKRKIKLEEETTVRSKPKLENITNLEINKAFTAMNLDSRKRKINDNDQPDTCKYTKLKKEKTLNIVREEDKVEYVVSTPKDETFIFSVIQHVLGRYHFNVLDRFCLDFKPQCVLNLENCASNHHLNSPIISDEFRIQLITDERYNHFVKSLNDMCLRNIFPGEDNLRTLLELILTINFTPNREKESNYIINQCVLTFQKILYMFPPCWRGLKEHYKNVLNGPMTLNLVDLDKFEPDKGIFHVVIIMLTELLHNEDKILFNEEAELKEDERIKNNGNFNFNEWNDLMTARERINRVTRNERIDRIFVILNIITKLFEMDLSIFAIKHPTNVNYHINTEHRKPLPVSVIWPDGIIGETNTMIKIIISLFIECIMLDFPYDKIKVFAKLLNVISHIIMMSELEASPTIIDYPRNEYNLTESFAREIFKIMENLKYFNTNRAKNRSMDLFISVVDQLRTPLIRLLLCDFIFNKIDNSYNGLQLNGKKFYNKFKHHQWHNCTPDNGISYLDNRDSKFQYRNNYKILNLKPQTINESLNKLNEIITTSDYMYLLYKAYTSYLSFYRLEDIIKILKKQKLPVILDNNNNKSTPIKEEKIKIDFDKFEEYIEFYENQISLNDKIIKRNTDNDTFANLMCVDANIVVRYREEVKYCVDLGSFIKENIEENKSLFNKFHKLFKEFLY